MLRGLSRLLRVSKEYPIVVWKLSRLQKNYSFQWRYDSHKNVFDRTISRTIASKCIHCIQCMICFLFYGYRAHSATYYKTICLQYHMIPSFSEKWRLHFYKSMVSYDTVHFLTQRCYRIWPFRDRKLLVERRSSRADVSIEYFLLAAPE